MFLLLNGAFGIGKTTVADLLVREHPRAILYDPERIGFVLRRLPAVVVGRWRRPDDYQDLWLWRRLIVIVARREHAPGRLVVIPMAFTNLAYLNDFAHGLSRKAPVKRVCLVAPLPVVSARLQRRADAEGRPVSAFERCRARECVAVHRDRVFGEPVDATATPEVIAGQLRAMVAAGCSIAG